MIRIVKRKDYSSEEEYRQVYEEMCKAIDEHNKMNPSISHNSIEELKWKTLNIKP